MWKLGKIEYTYRFIPYPNKIIKKKLDMRIKNKNNKLRYILSIKNILNYYKLKKNGILIERNFICDWGIITFDFKKEEYNLSIHNNKQFDKLYPNGFNEITNQNLL